MNIRLILVILIFSFASTTFAFASGSGGFRNETPDAGVFGKGSAFVGEANTPAAVYYNPAGLNQIDRPMVTVGTSVLAPSLSYKNPTGQTTQGRDNIFIVPNFYTVIPVISKKFTVGVGSGSYWGLGSEWASDSFSKYVATKSELQSMDLLLTGAYQVTDRWSLALSADHSSMRADENKIFPQDGIHDAGLALKAKSDSWGWRLATLFKINDQNQVGLMYRSSIHQNFIGKVYLDGLNNAGSFPYQTIFGGTSYETRATEKLTLPQSVIIGYSFKPTTRWTFNADLEWMDWSSLKREVINFPDETNATRLSVLTAGNPVNHDWTSAWSESAGAEYAATDRLKLRGGYYHHQQVGPQDDVTSAIPDSGSHGIVAGFGYDLTKNLTLDLAYSFIIYEPRKVHTTVGNLTSTNVSGTYSQTVSIGAVSLTYKF